MPTGQLVVTTGHVLYRHEKNRYDAAFPWTLERYRVNIDDSTVNINML